MPRLLITAGPEQDEKRRKNVAHWQKAGCRSAGDVAVDGQRSPLRAEGRASVQLVDNVQPSGPTRASGRHRSMTPARPAPPGAAAYSDRRTSYGESKVTRALVITGVGYRARAGLRPQADAGFQPRRHLQGAEGHHGRAPQPPKSWSRASTSSTSASSPPISANTRRSLTRARASAMRTTHAPQGRQEEVTSRTMPQPQDTDRCKARVRRAIKAGPRAPAPQRLPLRPEHLRPGHR